MYRGAGLHRGRMVIWCASWYSLISDVERSCHACRIPVSPIKTGAPASPTAAHSWRSRIEASVLLLGRSKVRFARSPFLQSNSSADMHVCDSENPSTLWAISIHRNDCETVLRFSSPSCRNVVNVWICVVLCCRGSFWHCQTKICSSEGAQNICISISDTSRISFERNP